MWLELLNIFRGTDPLKTLADEFMQMLQTAHDMARIVTPHALDHTLPLDQRNEVYRYDIAVNKAERSIRKGVATHLTLHKTNIPYCLLLMSLVKDIERIGDYAKNISQVGEMGGAPVPAGPLRDELGSVMQRTMELFDEARAVLVDENRERANELVLEGRNAAERCERLVSEAAKSGLSSAETTSLVLLARFYKRIGGHVLNILSSVVMPLHKVDFYDEKVAAIQDSDG